MCYLVSGSQLMNGKDLRGVKCLTEHIHSAELTAEDPIGIGCLRRAKETFIITLEQRKGGGMTENREVGDETDSSYLLGHQFCSSASFLWSLLNLFTLSLYAFSLKYLCTGLNHKYTKHTQTHTQKGADLAPFAAAHFNTPFLVFFTPRLCWEKCLSKAEALIIVKKLTSLVLTCQAMSP